MSHPEIALLDALFAAFPRVPAGEAGLPSDFVEEDDEALDVPTPRGRVYLVLRRSSSEAEIDLAWMQAEPPRTGSGSIVLRDLCERADRHGVRIKLIPKGQDPGLVAFYERHGFARAGRSDFLVRVPEDPGP